MEPGGNSPISLAGEPWSDVAPCVLEWPPCLGSPSFGWVPWTWGGVGADACGARLGTPWEQDATSGSTRALRPCQFPDVFGLSCLPHQLCTGAGLHSVTRGIWPQECPPCRQHPPPAAIQFWHVEEALYSSQQLAAARTEARFAVGSISGVEHRFLFQELQGSGVPAVSCDSSQHGAQEPQLFLNGNTCLKPIGIRSFPIPGADPHLAKATLPQGGDVLGTTSQASPSLTQEVSGCLAVATTALPCPADEWAGRDTDHFGLQCQCPKHTSEVTDPHAQPRDAETKLSLQECASTAGDPWKEKLMSSPLSILPGGWSGHRRHATK